MADILLLGFIAGYARGGWSSGFLRRLAGLGFMALAFVAGAYLRQPIGAIIGGISPQMPSTYAEMLGYTIAFSVLVVGFNIVTRPILSKVAVNGVSRKMDQVLGAVLGVAEAVLLISALIVILDTYFGTAGALANAAGLGFLKEISQALDDSTIGQFLIHTTVPFVLAILGPLLPKDVTTLIPTTGLPGTGVPGLGVPGFPLPTP